MDAINVFSTNNLSKLEEKTKYMLLKTILILINNLTFCIVIKNF